MPNPHKGEVEFTVGGKVYRAVLSSNAMCALEKELGQKVHSLENSLTTTRAVLWAALRKHHSDVTLEATGDLMDELGFFKAGELVREIFTLAFPVPEGPLATPGSQQGGTGPVS